MSARRKNILVMCMDDAFAFWRYRHAFGAELQVPNLDRICAQGTAFHNAYCQVPVCGPSRASFLSGLAPHQTGIFDNYSDIFERLRPEQMWSYRLKQAGYHCATAGKLHHGYKPRPPEIHDALYSHPARKCLLGPRADAPHRDFGGLMNGAGTTDPKDDAKYYDHYSSSDAVAFLQSHDGAAPFYREVGFHNPHPPFKTPVRFKELYDEAAFTRPEAWARGKDPDPFADAAYPPNLRPGNEEMWRKSVRNYFSGYSHVDAHIGRVWDALQASPHAANTVVIICADHGYHMGDKNRFRKYTLWEEAAGVPLIVIDPDHPGPRVVEDPVALLDIGPTVMDYAGLPPIPDSPGRSLRAQVEGLETRGRAVPTFWFGSVAIRQGRFRFIRYQDGSEQLFDLEEDPWQLSNIVEGHADRDRLLAALMEASAAHGLHLDDGNRPGPGGYHALAPDAPAPASAAQEGLLTMGPLPAPLPDAPGQRRLFLRLSGDMEIDMPPGYQRLHYGGDVGDGPNTLAVRCHDDGSRIDFNGGHRRCEMHVTGGRGDDRIEVTAEPLHADLRAGDNRVVAGNANATIFAGSGADTIDCRRGDNLVHGGAGRALVLAGTGQDRIETGPGGMEIVTGPGQTRIVIAAGSNTMRLLGQGAVDLEVRRTGLPQVVEAFKGGRITVADCGALRDVTVARDGDDTLLTCGAERVRFRATDPQIVADALAAPRAEG